MSQISLYDMDSCYARSCRGGALDGASLPGSGAVERTVDRGVCNLRREREGAGAAGAISMVCGIGY